MAAGRKQTYSIFKKTCIAGEGFGPCVEEPAANAPGLTLKWWIVFKKRREAREGEAPKPLASPLAFPDL